MKSEKRLFICIFAIGIVVLSGCGLSRQSKTDSESEHNYVDKVNDEELEVVFLNYYPCMGRDTEVPTKNKFYSAYILDEDPETLYAFLVRIDHYYDGTSYFPKDYPTSDEPDYMRKRSRYETAKAVELMEQTDLIILEDYPYCSYNRDETWAPDSGDIDHLSLGLCTVVGTLDDIRKVFDETEPMDGWYCYVWSAPRPDMVEKIKESGWTGTSDLLESYSDHSDFYKSILGEENQVTISVKLKK